MTFPSAKTRYYDNYFREFQECSKTALLPSTVPRGIQWILWIIHTTLVKVMGQVTIVSHSMGPTFYGLTSLSSHVNRQSHSWNTTFQNLTLKIQSQGHVWGQSWKSQSGCNILLTHTFFVSCQSTLPFLRYKICPNLTLMIQGENEMTMMYNYRSRQCHVILNGINPSSGFRDIVSKMSGPSAASFYKFWAIGITSKWANYFKSAQTQV